MMVIEKTTTPGWEKYDQRYGSPYDRGAADAWYWRPKCPHYFLGDSFSSPMVYEHQMTPEEIEAYNAGYDEQDGRKDWG